MLQARLLRGPAGEISGRMLYTNLPLLRFHEMPFPLHLPCSFLFAVSSVEFHTNIRALLRRLRSGQLSFNHLV